MANITNTQTITLKQSESTVASTGNNKRVALYIQNKGGADVYLSFAVPVNYVAPSYSGLTIPANSMFKIEENCPTDTINMRTSDVNGSDVYIAEIFGDRK